ncbi:hypothetical protein DPMN_008455 [Dreissena polymorpha]|uniref:HTH CENPB-type domain-containing protein n=1 Tax=Dreissena polymorpha TaxID=45954 RepID=A0A9D4RZ62_DREPO|nr:hypothetical protein DPMN_008455 [Dreissena polymorpha]
MPISGPNIQHQALKFHNMLHPEDESFVGSAGWLRSFKSRHSIVRGLQIGLRYAEKSAKSTPAEVMHLRNILYRAKSEARSSLKQTELTDYFFCNKN